MNIMDNLQCTHKHRHRIHGGAIALTVKKLWGRRPQVAPQELCYVIFETLKIRIYHHASEKSCADFNLKCTKSTPPDLSGFNSGGRDKGRRKGKRQEGINS